MPASCALRQATKRKAEGGGGGAKKPKPDASTVDWPALASGGLVPKQTVCHSLTF